MKPRLGIYEKKRSPRRWTGRNALKWRRAWRLILLKSPLTKAPSARPGCAGTGGQRLAFVADKLTAALMCRACASAHRSHPLVASIAIPGLGAGTDA